MEALETLKTLFSDFPETLEIFSLDSLETEYLKQKFREKAFASRINLWVTGRTRAGKTSLGNSLLDIPAMLSTGFQDCTAWIGFFDLQGNLRFFDSPGVCSQSEYENINRVALFLEQKSPGKYSKTGNIKMFTDSDILPLKDYTGCSEAGQEKDIPITVRQWQSSEVQKEYGHDIILYIVPPHELFLEADREYLGLLLETWRDIVVPVLNIHRTPDGKQKATPQNIKNCREGIIEVYQQALKTNETPNIIEVNCFSGDGIAKITEQICRILPSNKVGNFGQVLQQDFKGRAQKEQQTRYYQSLCIIAAVLSRYQVDKKIDGRGLLNTAAEAIKLYGFFTFKNADALSTVDISAVSSKVEKLEQDKTKAQIDKQDIYELAPKTESRQKSENVTTTRDVLAEVPEVIETNGWFGRKKQNIVMTQKKFTLSQTNREITGYEDVVVGTYQKLIGQEDVFNGMKYEKGGYEAIELLLGLGLAVESFCDPENKSPNWQASFDQALLFCQRKLEPYQNQIKQLVEDSDTEQQLIQTLQNILINQN